MPIDWLSAPDYSISRMLIGRGLAAIYLIGFIVALRQFRPLLGERGLLPVPQFVRAVPFMSAPSLFQWRYSDRQLGVVAWMGAGIAAALLLGLPQAASLPLTMLAWIVLWALYLSIVNVGQTFYAFGWESLLLEAGFLAIFLGSDAVAPSALVIFLYRWLAFRVEFGAGLIKMRGDRCWRDLTCLEYHHQTQPMPNPLSWYFHRLPRRFHRLEVLGNHAAQLVVPFGLFLPQPVAGIAGAYMILTQLYLVVSGNYAWLNWITIVVALAALPDGMLEGLLPFAHSMPTPPPLIFTAGAIGLTLLVAALSYQPVRNLLGRRQLMNYSFNSLHIVNTYGAFGSVTRQRDEVIVEGTKDPAPTDGSPWLEYEFKGKPGDPMRRPSQFAPYHLRLDWLMWFLPLSPAYGEQWFSRFLEGLLRNDAALLGLLRTNPFPDRPPLTIRARLYRYRYTTWSERRRTGAWWVREPLGEYFPAVSLRQATQSLSDER
jgi:Lipase maturation factor